MLNAVLMVWVGIQSAFGAPSVDHVIVISVDGLRSDAITQLARQQVPGMFRLMDDAGTLDARCDPSYPLTLPNHTTMVTGRPVLGDKGHRWTGNGVPSENASYHNHVGHYVASMFDVAHDNGVKTALFAGKDKFILMDRSWDESRGALDQTGVNNGRDKIDQYVMTGDSAKLTDALLGLLESNPERSLSLIHFRDPDAAGHGAGWDLTPNSLYLKSIIYVDRYLEAILSYLDRRPALKAKTAILLTADHGGGVPFKSHFDPNAAQVYTIPFLAWVGGHGQKGNLYAWSGSARKISDKNPAGANPPPIRNGDIANGALHLLGLSPVPGSVINPKQDLILRPR